LKIDCADAEAELQWVDAESQFALLFAARRVGHDAVAVIFAPRDVPIGPELSGVKEFRLGGLSPTDSVVLLAGRRTDPVVMDRLVSDTAGNPLGLLEAARRLSASQLRGSAPLPPVLPVGQRIEVAFLADRPELSTAARRTLTVAAASLDQSAGPVVAALTSAGIDAQAALEEAEQTGLLSLTDGELAFRHPLITAAVWHQASPGDRRSAHAA
jgi:hypothetical protein